MYFEPAPVCSRSVPVSDPVSIPKL
jgi:hypothetical protein